MPDPEEPNAAEETPTPEDAATDPAAGADETVDAGEAAQESLDAAQEATDAVEQAAGDPATPVDAEMDEKTSAALKAAQEAIASLNTHDDASGDGAQPDAAAEAGDSAPLSNDDIMAQMAAQMSAEEGIGTPADEGNPFEMPTLENTGTSAKAGEVELLADVNLQVKIELGRTRMFVEDVLKLGEGAVVELDKAAGDPVDIYVNDRPVARGEVLVINDCFCVRISEIISSQAKQN